MAMQVGGAGGEEKPMSDINTTPLVDVMLVLLIIFLIAVAEDGAGAGFLLDRADFLAQRDALLLAAGELVGMAVAEIGQH